MSRGLFDEIDKFTPNNKSKFSEDSNNYKLGSDTGLKSQFKNLRLTSQDRFKNSLGFIVFILIFFLVFIAKSFVLQVIEGEENFDLAEGNRVRINNIVAERGLILDRNGEVLVRNQPAFGLKMDATLCNWLEINCLEELKEFSTKYNLQLDFERLEEDINLREESIILVSDLTKEEILSIEAGLSEYRFFSVFTTPKRDYLLAEALSHVVGYVGFADTLRPQIEGKSGVEASYNNYLSGIDGGEVVQVNSAGRKVSILSERQATPGEDLSVYLDKGLQNLAYKLLKQEVEEGPSVAGAIVAQDPKTGGILALVSYPSFDSNKLSGGISQKEFSRLIEKTNMPFFNRAISGVYPPASTFKMVMASAVLEEGIVSPDYQINDKGFIQVGSYIFRNWKKDGHGLVNLKRALQVSNDTYFYTVGGGYGNVEGLGIDKINKWATRFGLGKLTKIDIPEETKGFIPDSNYKDWYLGDTYISSIGQGDVLTTPLQINNITAYFGNGGKLYSPRVVKDYDNQPEVLAKDLISRKNYEIVRQGLNVAVEPGGTGYPFFDFEDVYGIKVAGKTGTAEFGARDNEDTHAWFTIFGPYSNEDDAEIALTVFLENGGGGSDSAAPIARKLFDYWFD